MTPAEKAAKNKWRTYEQLHTGERWDIMHSENPPSLMDASRLLWRVTANGWECIDRSLADPRDL